jgi:hypothetical protein
VSYGRGNRSLLPVSKRSGRLLSGIICLRLTTGAEPASESDSEKKDFSDNDNKSGIQQVVPIQGYQLEKLQQEGHRGRDFTRPEVVE